MEIDRRQIRQISARTGLGLKFVSKDIFLSTALKMLENILGEEYVLKGDTAITRAGYLRAPRFSEDVDFDIFTGEDYKKIGKQTTPLLGELTGFEVKRPRIQPNCLRYDAYFENHFGEKDRIRIDISSKPGELPDELAAPKTLLQSPFTSGQACLLRAYSKPELFVRKLHALSDRSDGKDPFDLWGMWVLGVPVNEIYRVLDNYAASINTQGSEILSNALQNIDRMSSNITRIANSASHFIPRSERPDWVILLRDLREILERIASEDSPRLKPRASFQ